MLEPGAVKCAIVFALRGKAGSTQTGTRLEPWNLGGGSKFQSGSTRTGTLQANNNKRVTTYFRLSSTNMGHRTTSSATRETDRQ